MLDFLDDFQKKVMFVILILFIIILSVFTIIIYKNKNKNAAYKMKNVNCPDYWQDNSQGNGSNCVNTKHLGTCDIEDMDFSLSKWVGDDGLCHKLKWSRSCDLTWDGITNNPNIKCSNEGNL